LDIDVTTPRAGVFRDAICELLQQELGANLTTLVRNPERERERKKEVRKEERKKQRKRDSILIRRCMMNMMMHAHLLVLSGSYP